MSQIVQDTSTGNTIKLEDFEKLPNGMISAGVTYFNNEKMLFVVYKHSNLDWNLYLCKWKNGKTLIDNIRDIPDIEDCIIVTEEKTIKRLFNCSKNIMKLLSI